MSSFAVAALASGCFFQQPITLAMNVEVVPVSRPFAFRGETEFALRMASELVRPELGSLSYPLSRNH